jgi:SOS response regulatory protein OraA/RecX
VNEVYLYALKLLARRDYATSELRAKLEAKFGKPAENVLDELARQNLLNDRRVAENLIHRKIHHAPAALREELIARGIPVDIADETISEAHRPSLRQVLTDKMDAWDLRPPLRSRDAARLFRALVRLGYSEDAIRE